VIEIGVGEFKRTYVSKETMEKNTVEEGLEWISKRYTSGQQKQK
jgi:hypothetical protein